MVGLRLAMNDAQSSEALLGIIKDADSSAVTYNLEASRRLGDNWTLEVEARFFTNIKRDDPLRGLHKDDYLQLGLARHF